MNGATIIAARPSAASATTGTSKASADTNGDGKDDIIWRNDNARRHLGDERQHHPGAAHVPAVSADWHIAGNHYDFI